MIIIVAGIFIIKDKKKKVKVADSISESADIPMAPQPEDIITIPPAAMMLTVDLSTCMAESGSSAIFKTYNQVY